MGFLFLFTLLVGSAPAAANPWIDAFLQIQENSFQPTAFIPLHTSEYPIHHPQGIKVIGDRAYLASVKSGANGAGYLTKFRISNSHAAPTARLRFPTGANGRLIHAGGLDGNADYLYVPNAEYDTDGPTEIFQVDLNRWDMKPIGTVNDHAGTLIFGEAEETMWLFDWSTGLFSVPFSDLDFRSPQEIRRPKRRFGSWEYQDCKSVGDHHAICSAKRGLIFVDGEIHLIRLENNRMDVAHRVPVPRVKGNGEAGGRRPLTYNAMDFELTSSGLRFYFVPHDDEDAHLMIYDIK